MNSWVLRVVGSAFVIVGLVLASNPELVSSAPIPSDTFEAVEQRIPWGKLIGLGLLPFFHRRLRPWGATVAATLSSLIVGYLIARLVGIALDGSTMKQWLYVGVELVILAPLAWWYLKVRVKDGSPRG